MSKKGLIKDENDEVESIALLLVDDNNNNVLKQYLEVEKIDYSVNSLKIVDNYLDKVRKKLSEEEIKKVILRCGTYLGRVIRKVNPNRFIWISYDTAVKISGKGLPIPDDLTTAFILYDKANERFWFPLSKVYKFLYHGRADNLWSFAVICLKFKEKKRTKNE